MPPRKATQESLNTPLTCDPKLSARRVNRGPVWYGFRASAKAPIDVKLKYSTVLQKSFSGL